MRYLSILIVLVFTSCIKISSDNLQLQTLDQGVSQKKAARESAGFWEAMQQLDFQFAAQFPDSSEEHQFSAGLKSALMGEYELAVKPLEHLIETSQDTNMVKFSGVLLTGIYTLLFDWDALLRLDAQLPGGIDDLNTIAMVKAWNLQKDEVIHYPEVPLTLDSEKSISGVPMIQVEVNGVQQTFWIDTGADFTVLSSDIAEICGVDPLVESASKVGTSTDKKVDLWPGVIDELKIGELVFENHPVFIISKEDLEFRLFKIIKLLKVDGILGWNALQNLKVELDYHQDKVTFQKPVQKDREKRNFNYLTQPFVTVLDTMGVPFHFFLDTGANATGFYDPALAFFDTSAAETSTAMVGGAGGTQKITQLTLKDQSLILSKTRINFSSIHAQSMRGDSEEGFIHYDGILGSDVARGAVLILDFQNGWCELKPAQD